MDRRAALVAVALAVGGGVAVAKKHDASSTKQPLALHVRSIDLEHRLILLEVDGLTKAPPANYFTMTDERGYHYIAQTIHCDPPFASGSRVCELEMPAGYERHPLRQVELHKGGLHGRAILVDAAEVKAAWSAAEQAHAEPTSESGAAPVDLGRPLDSGTRGTDPQK